MQVQHVPHPTRLELGDLVVSELEIIQVRHVDHCAVGNLGDALVVERKTRTRAGSARFHHRLIRIQPEGALIATLAKLRQPCRRRRGRDHHHQHRENEQPATTRERSVFDLSNI